MGFSGQFLRSGALLFLIAGSILLSGCRSDVYYQNRAVERARKFLLANAPETVDGELIKVPQVLPGGEMS